MTATGHIASITLLAIPAILLLTQVTAAQQRPAGQSASSLIVTPSTSIAFSGPRGGPFAPSPCRVSSKRIDRYRQLLDQNSVLAYREFDLRRD